jgi:hypothetical protein
LRRITTKKGRTRKRSNRTFTQEIRETEMEFIRRMMKYYVLKTGKSPTVALLAEKEKPKLYVGPSEEIKAKDFQRKYLVQSDVDGQVIRFTPTFEIINKSDYQKVTGIARDEDTGAPVIVKRDRRYPAESGTESNRIVGHTIAGLVQKEYPPSKLEMIQNTIQNDYDAMSKRVNTAELEVYGDAKLNFEQPVWVAVPTPYGKLYPTSGVWRVIKIVDSLSPGRFTSTLSLVRTSSGFGLKMVNSEVQLIPSARTAKKVSKGRR